MNKNKNIKRIGGGIAVDILIISGLSGGGKSKTASFLEDMDFYIVDNMPAAMILRFAEFCVRCNGRYDRVALVYDVRTASTSGELTGVLKKLRAMKGVDCKVLFLDADPDVIIKRYKETRRRHPLLDDDMVSLEEAVQKERELMKSTREQADFIINTSRMSTAQLRGELLRLFGRDEKAGLLVNVISFGFKHGLPLEADLVFDVRFMPNPFYIEELRQKTGLDAPVADYVFNFQQTREYMNRLKSLLDFSLPLYAEEGKTTLVIAIGCTGGHHRSVAVAHALAEFIREKGYQTTENHRDITHSV